MGRDIVNLPVFCLLKRVYNGENGFEMKKTICSFFLIIYCFLLVSPVSAELAPPTLSPTPIVEVEYYLPYPGILPNHPLYFLKNIRDQIILWSTRDLVKKSQLYLLLADKKIAMTQALWEQKIFDLSLQTGKKAEYDLLTSVEILVKLDKSSPPRGLLDRFELACKKHEEILTKIMITTDGEERREALSEIIKANHQAKQNITSLK